MTQTTNSSQGSDKQEHFGDAFTGKILHPALDYQNDVLSVGFSYTSNEMTAVPIHFLSVRGTHPTINKSAGFDREGVSYRYDTKPSVTLPSLEERWGVKAAKEFVEGNIVPPTDLIETLASDARNYIGFESDIDSYIIAAWAVGTYFHPLFNAYPFLSIKAPKGSGKSQCLGFLKQVCFNATKARPSLAALGDTIDALCGTYLIDQADTLGQKGKEEMLDILADSYKKGGGTRQVMNMDKKTGRGVLQFKTYGPKAFASIHELPEDLRDRCIVVPLIRKNKPFGDPNDSWHDWCKVRGLIYQSLLSKAHEAQNLYEAARATHGKNGGHSISGRTLELWLPIEVMLRLCGGESKIEDVKKRFLKQYGFAAEYEPDELETQVISTILEKLATTEAVWLTPKEIARNMPPGCFPPRIDDPIQRAAAVGWAIKKFNLSSDKESRSSGVCHRFDKQKVETIRDGYFKTRVYPPAPTSTDPKDFRPSFLQRQDAGVEDPTIQHNPPLTHPPEETL